MASARSPDVAPSDALMSEMTGLKKNCWLVAVYTEFLGTTLLEDALGAEWASE
jgi:hypothetical protein